MAYKVAVTCCCCGKMEELILGDYRDTVYLADILEVLGWDTNDGENFWCPKHTSSDCEEN